MIWSVVIQKYAGRDATKAYLEYHSSTVAKDTLSLECFKGNLDRSTIPAEWKQSPAASTNNAQAASDDEKPPLHSILNLYEGGVHQRCQKLTEV